MTEPTKPRRRPRPICTLMIREAGKLNAAGRHTLGAWLRRQATNVEKHGAVYSPTFKVRYR